MTGCIGCRLPKVTAPSRRSELRCDVLCCRVCWEKFTRYFDVEEHFIPLTEDSYVMRPEAAIEACDENTIGGYLVHLRRLIFVLSLHPRWQALLSGLPLFAKDPHLNA